PVARFAYVVRFLLSTYPENFTPVELAYQLHISLGMLQDLLHERAEVASMLLLEELARISGVPLSFLTQGSMEAVPADPAALSTYASALMLALQRGISPERLEALISRA
ncbi:MAG TPA: hypothetical protein VD902_03510, partial [Symbiobacteriaceae bacterium]|nr:hypothetical protein [Symbiobacteriaceae bacterium]